MTEDLPAWAESVADLERVPAAMTRTAWDPETAWGGADGAGVRVAVIDSGIHSAHPALEGCVDEAGSMVVTLDEANVPVVRQERHDDLFGHGTACAGVIHSIAPRATITSVRVLNERLSGKAAVFLRALSWAVDERFDIINLSLGTTRNDWALPFYQVCDDAYFRGSLVVTAANNVARRSFPSLYASVVSVSCTDAENAMEFHVNLQPPTEFLARGIDVELAWRDGRTIIGTGNSYAAPHISGIAALILSKHPSLRPFEIKSVLWATAANVRGSSEAHLPGSTRRTPTTPVRGVLRAGARGRPMPTGPR